MFSSLLGFCLAKDVIFPTLLEGEFTLSSGFSIIVKKIINLIVIINFM